MNLYLDIETYSDLDLTKVGAYRYASHPSTRVILIGYAIEDDRVLLIEPDRDRAAFDIFLDLLCDQSLTKWAHNANFERALLSRHVDCDPAAWRCTMVWAQMLMLPAGLGQCAQALQLIEGKLDQDRSLMKRFSFKAGGDPEHTGEKWEAYREYCRRDVEVMRNIHRRLSKFPIPESENLLWAVDQRINDRGMPVDVDFVRAASKIVSDHKAHSTRKAQAIAGVDNPQSRPQLLKWLADNGVHVSDLQKKTIELALESGGLPDHVETVLRARQQFAATSLSKFDKLAQSVEPDGRYRGAFRFYKAHTGRWAGQGVQPHNLPKGIEADPNKLQIARELVLGGSANLFARMYPDPTAMLSTLVRTSFAAPPGKKLVVADYAGIETVMLGWMVQSDYILGLFEKGLDPYKEFATRLYGIEYDTVTKAQRNICKPPTLGCGYMMGKRGLQAYAANFGIALDLEEAQRQVEVYRGSYPEVPKFWDALLSAVFYVVEEHSELTVGAFTIRYESPYLFIVLPSGRSLAYYRPRVGPHMAPWGAEIQSFSYESAPGFRHHTHAGELTENIDQAISRDILGDALVRVEYGLPDYLEVVAHVHDEVVCLADEDDEHALSRLIASMSVRPHWAPNAPITVAGWEGRFYRKD